MFKQIQKNNVFWHVIFVLSLVSLGYFRGRITECGKQGRTIEELRVEVADLHIKNNELAEQNSCILENNKALNIENEKLYREREQVGVQLANANAELDVLRNAEPSYPEMESHPLVINLRLQLGAQDTRFSLAMEDIAKANRVIENQMVEIKGLEQAYQNALQMYLNSDKVLNDSLSMNARLNKQNKLYKKVATYEGVALVVVVLFSLVK